MRAARITGYDVQTLMNMAYVASAYPPARRHEVLSWTHHAEVAGLDAVEREKLLARAETERMSARCLREELRRRRRAESRSAQACPTRASEQTGGRVCPHCGCAIDAVELGNAKVSRDAA